VVFTPNFARITARYRPKPFISGAIENKVKTGALRFCARSNLRLLSFNDPEYQQLQACFNVETEGALRADNYRPMNATWACDLGTFSGSLILFDGQNSKKNDQVRHNNTDLPSLTHWA
jgi:hypothetical protein